MRFTKVRFLSPYTMLQHLANIHFAPLPRTVFIQVVNAGC